MGFEGSVVAVVIKNQTSPDFRFPDVGLSDVCFFFSNISHITNPRYKFCQGSPCCIHC